MAATYTLRVAGDCLPFRSDYRNSKIFETVQYTESSPLSEHQTENSCHLFSHCIQVEGALALSMECWTVSEHSVSCGSGPAVAKPSAASDEGRDARSGP